jgi:hypothetical protein
LQITNYSRYSRKVLFLCYVGQWNDLLKPTENWSLRKGEWIILKKLSIKKTKIIGEKKENTGIKAKAPLVKIKKIIIRIGKEKVNPKKSRGSFEKVLKRARGIENEIGWG